MTLPTIKTGLRLQIILSFIITVAILVNAAGWFLHRRARTYFDIELGKTLIGVAKVGADLLDTELLPYLKPGDDQGEFYKGMQTSLRILQLGFQVKRVLVVDRSFKVLLDTEPDTPIGASLPHLQGNLHELDAALQGRAVYSTLYRSYKGGLYKSAYAPVRNQAGAVVAIVGVDASPDFLRIIGRFENLIWLINVISIAVTIAISLFLARGVLNPVKLLVAAAQRVSRGDLSQPVAVAAQNEIGFLGEVFDAMQQNIRRNEERLKSLRQIAEGRAESIQAYNNYILKSIAHGILSIDLNGTITIINPAAEKILQLSSREAVGKEFGEVFPSGSPLNTYVREVLQNAQPREMLELQLHGRGNPQVISVQASPLIDAQQNVIGINLVLTDLTEIRALQEQIKEKERLAYLGQLSATIAHEIRNPLNSIELFIGLLQRRHHDDKEREHAIGKIQKEIQALNAIITDFLLFARPGEVKWQSFAASKLFQEVLFLAAKELKEKNISVRINVADKKLRMLGDFNQLKRALLNIVLNAIQAMDERGTLTLAANVSNQERKRSIRLEVSDTGKGIPAANLEMIFQPFYSTHSQGTGLGLAIVKNVILAHHGTIVVKNNEPKGTQFIIYLESQGESQREDHSHR
jgi:PAS domain S-box-containing protein